MFRIALLLGFICFFSGIEGLDYYVEDAYFEELNTEYFDNETTGMEVVWANESVSGIALNLTMIKSIPSTAKVYFDIYIKTMGQYKTHSGITASVPWCNAIADPVLVGSLLRALGMTNLTCPAPPGRYGTEFWKPATELLPTNFPAIDYKVVFSIKLDNRFLLMIWAFVSVF